ncbi:hypothetical protein PR048_028063 [Dryococelus australis]|uniref:BTB domain-containing protein n=1 Tax=Dryococelus australis TaxID=614101 RepID=A0ABQ9GI97_9NEOP|nr:hypothetical protein PR048_028063 [Dryococelus australis]
MVVNDARQNLSKKGWCMMSSAVTINSLSWMLCVKNENGSHIGATLYLGGTKDSTRYVYAECKIKLVSADPHDSVVRICSNDFCRGRKVMGFENMLPLKVFPETRRGELDPTLPSLNTESITDRAEYFMLSEVCADCEFSVGSHPNVEHIRACKAILAKASEVFQAMFFGSFQSDCVIRVSDIEPEVFYTMLRHIYGAEWTVESRQQAADLYYAANKYILEELKNSCLQFLWPYCISDAWDALEMALVYDLDDLEEAAMRIIRRNTDKVFKREEFLSLSRQCVVKILQ